MIKTCPEVLTGSDLLLKTCNTISLTFSSHSLGYNFLHFFCIFIATRQGLGGYCTGWLKLIIDTHFCIAVPLTESMLCLGVWRFCPRLNTVVLLHHITSYWVVKHSVDLDILKCSLHPPAVEIVFPIQIERTCGNAIVVFDICAVF